MDASRLLSFVESLSISRTSVICGINTLIASLFTVPSSFSHSFLPVEWALFHTPERPKLRINFVRMKGMTYMLKNRERNQTENIRHTRINFISNLIKSAF